MLLGLIHQLQDNISLIKAPFLAIEQNYCHIVKETLFFINKKTALAQVSLCLIRNLLIEEWQEFGRKPRTRAGTSGQDESRTGGRGGLALVPDQHRVHHGLHDGAPECRVQGGFRRV